MNWEVNITANDEQSYSDVSRLADGSVLDFPNYALCLPDYSLLDGNYENAPDNLGKDNGFISTLISGADGSFSEKPVITITYERKKTSNGLQMQFNSHSGDYCNSLNITWYLNDIQVDTYNFTPDSSAYFCKRKVTSFNKIVITFNSTNKPYRYLFLSRISNERLTRYGGLKIVHDDIALGAKEESSLSSADIDYRVDITNLKEENGVNYPNYGLCLPKYSLLDGNYENAPATLGDMGYMSNIISDENGAFTTPPSIIITFATNKYSSGGITLVFNDYTEEYCSAVNIKWYNDNVVSADEDFTPDSYQYFCNKRVDNYNKVVITFLETSKPYRPVFLTRIDYGIERIYDRNTITKASCLLEISPISEVLSINTLDFSIKSTTDISFTFQKKQEVKLYFDEALICRFFLKNGKRTSDVDYSFETQDVSGVLDGATYYGGIYNNITVPNLIADILTGEDVDYYIDDSFNDITLSGYLKICTKREALAQVGFAVGAVIDTSFDDNLYFYPQQTTLSGTIENDDIYTGTTSVEYSDAITGVNLTAHKYTQSNETVELYNESLNGTVIITFSEPHYNLSITGGTIVECGSNFAKITSTGNAVVLSGKRYTDTKTIYAKTNPDITLNQNVISVADATLVTSSNAQSVLNRVYDYYSGNVTVKSKILLKDYELGQVVSINTNYDGYKQGTIEKLSLKFTNEISAEVIIK